MPGRWPGIFFEGGRIELDHLGLGSFAGFRVERGAVAAGRDGQ